MPRSLSSPTKLLLSSELENEYRIQSILPVLRANFPDSFIASILIDVIGKCNPSKTLIILARDLVSH